MTTNEIIAAIQQTPRCSNIEKWRLVDFLKNEIGKASLCVGGQPMHENDLYFIREEVVKRIYKEYPFLHLGELHIIFDEGSYEKFGQVYSLTPLAINRWIVAYLESDCRKKAVQEINRISADRQLTQSPTTTPQSEYDSMRYMLGEMFNRYIANAEWSDFRNFLYFFLEKLGLIKLSADDKRRLYSLALKTPEEKHPKVAARTLAVKEYFEKVKSAGEHVLDRVPEQMIPGYTLILGDTNRH